MTRSLQGGSVELIPISVAAGVAPAGVAAGVAPAIPTGPREPEVTPGVPRSHPWLQTARGVATIAGDDSLQNRVVEATGEGGGREPRARAVQYLGEAAQAAEECKRAFPPGTICCVTEAVLDQKFTQVQ